MGVCITMVGLVVKCEICGKEVRGEGLSSIKKMEEHLYVYHRFPSISPRMEDYYYAYFDDETKDKLKELFLVDRAVFQRFADVGNKVYVVFEIGVVSARSEDMLDRVMKTLEKMKKLKVFPYEWRIEKGFGVDWVYWEMWVETEVLDRMLDGVEK